MKKIDIYLSLKLFLISTCVCSLIFVPIAFAMDPNSFEIAVQEYRAGNYEKSLNMLNQLENEDPENLYVKYYKAISYVKLGNLDEAKKYYLDIISNSDDPKLSENSKKGLQILDPQYYQKIQKNNFSMIETSQNVSKNIQETKSPAHAIYPKPPSGISQDEINNLVSLLAKNPSAIQTLIKLAKSSNPNLQVSEPQKNIDPENLAKWVRMMTLNSQMDLLKSNNNNDDENKNNDNSFFDMSKFLSGMSKIPSNNNPNNNDDLKNYLNNMSGEANMNPDILNMLFQQGMDSNKDNSTGF